MTKLYSITTRGFYPAAMRADYEAVGTWPADAAITTPDEEAAIHAGLAAGGTISGTSGAWVITPRPLDPLATRQAARWGAIKAERDRRKEGGTKVGASWFHSDSDSRIQQLGLVIMGAAIPAGLQWKTLDGSFVTMTQTLAGQIFGATAASDQAIFGKAEQHKAAMMASSAPEQYDFLAGWPKIFGE